MDMDLLSKPLQEPVELASSKILFDISILFADLVPKLSGHHVSQTIAGKVAEGSSGPVDVLQTAFGVVAGLKTQELLAN